jgi:hypothetical protein
VPGQIGITAAKLRRIEEGELISEYETWDKLAVSYGWPRSWASEGATPGVASSV